jgi:putative Mn2+ efflux pump MntP
MGSLEIILIAVGLAMDAFAVALAAGATGRASGPRAAFRLSFHFGLFQFLMPVLGWLAGSTISHLISEVDHWIAFALLTIVGLRMIRTGLRGEPGEDRDPSRGITLLTLSVATSLDALAVGLSLAMLKVSIWYPCIIIGLVASGFSLFGFGIGHRLGKAFGQRMEMVGGLILVLIGLRILLTHLTS